MGYTILQQGAKAPTVEQLKKALGSVPGLLAPDAAMHCKETFGIIVRNFSGTQAAALQANLKAEGIETEIIEDAGLPPIPVTKVVRRIDCVPEALMIYDPYGRKFPVEWGHVMVLAAGNVRKATFERKRTEVVDVKIRVVHGMIPVPERTVKVGYTTQEGATDLQRAEIVLTRGVAQYTIEAEGFNYSTLGERVTQVPATNFLLVLRELRKYAPQATLNRGAAAMLAEPSSSVAYPHKNSLQDEIQWWLWKLKT